MSHETEKNEPLQNPKPRKMLYSTAKNTLQDTAQRVLSTGQVGAQDFSKRDAADELDGGKVLGEIYNGAVGATKSFVNGVQAAGATPLSPMEFRARRNKEIARELFAKLSKAAEDRKLSAGRQGSDELLNFTQSAHQSLLRSVLGAPYVSNPKLDRTPSR